MSAWTEEQVPPSQTPSGQTVPQRAAVVRVAAEVGTQIDALDQGFDAAETDLGQGAGSPLTGALADGATARRSYSGRC